MVDRIARENLANRLRKLANGTITNFEFERRARRSRSDPAIRDIEFRLAWRCYDDFQEHCLSGEWAVSDGVRKDFARAVLFLKSEQEYRWTRISFLSGLLRRVLSGRSGLEPTGDWRYWPFWSREDYRCQLKGGAYLGSKR